MSSISKRKNRYYYRYRDTSGTQHTISLHTNDPHKAQNRKLQYDRMLEHSGQLQHVGMTVEELFHRYMSERASHKSDKRRHSLTQYFRVFADIHHKTIQEIRREDILRYAETNHSHSYRYKILSLLRNMIQYAQEEGWVFYDCTKSILLRNEQTEYRWQYDFLSPEDLKRVFELAAEKFPVYCPMFKLAYYTGMRLGEVRLLEWSEIDIMGRRIFLSPYKVKTRRAQFVILNRKAIEIIESTPRTNDFLFPNPDTNRPFSDRHPAKITKKILKALKLYHSGITGHIYRKSFISHLIQNGASPKEVQELARHSDIRTTMNIYARLSPEHLADALEKLPILD